MITVTLTIDTERRLLGVAYARSLYNKDNPNNQILTDEDYIMFVAATAADSWADQAERAAKIEAAGVE